MAAEPSSSLVTMARLWPPVTSELRFNVSKAPFGLIAKFSVGAAASTSGEASRANGFEPGA